MEKITLRDSGMVTHGQLHNCPCVEVKLTACL